MKLVKEIATNKYLNIDQATYDANPSLYIDRSDRPAYWLNHYADAGYTYWQSRYIIKELWSASNGFVDFNSTDVDAFCEYAYGDRNEIVTHYMTKGLDQATAQGLMVLKASENVARLALDAKDIAASPKMMQIGIKYLTVINEQGDIDSSQAYNLTEAINDFKKLYEDYAILGVDYEDDHEGIMDYFESTNSYIEGGLKNYTFNPSIVAALGSEDAARLAMVAELKDLFVIGNK